MSPKKEEGVDVEAKIEELASETKKKDGLSYITSLIDEIEKSVPPNFSFDTGVIVDNDLTSVIIKDSKVCFGHNFDDCRPFDEVKDSLDPYTAYRALELAKDVTKSYLIALKRKKEAEEHKYDELVDMFG